MLLLHHFGLWHLVAKRGDFITPKLKVRIPHPQFFLPVLVLSWNKIFSHPPPFGLMTNGNYPSAKPMN
jgi:hypothetical protein